MKRIFIFFFVLTTTLLFSQSKIDSLELELKRADIDTVKINILHKIYQQYVYNNPNLARQKAIKAIKISIDAKNDKFQVKSYNLYADFLRIQSSFDSSLTYYKKALERAKKIKFNKGHSIALVGIGNCYMRKGDYEKALEYQKLNLDFAMKTQDKVSIASSNKSMGDIHMERAEYAKAMEYYTQASKKYQQLNNLKELGVVLANMGLVFRLMNNYKSSESYFIQSDSLFKKVGFENGRAFILQNLSIVYKNTGKLDMAIKYSEKAISIYTQMGNRKMISDTYYAIGNISWEQEDFVQAINSYKRALDIALQIADSSGIAYCYKAIGDSYSQLNENKKARKFWLKTIDITSRIEINRVALGTYENLAESYAQEGNYKKAYEYKNQYSKIKDTLSAAQSINMATEIEAKYQNEQKTKEIALLASENNLQTLRLNKQKNERNGIIAFAIIMLLLAGLLYNQYRIKQKANKKLTELDRLKSNFFANISHEFRTPLTLIKGPIEQLEQNPDERLSNENVKMIRRNTSRVLNLVNQLLDLSKIDEGNLKLEPTEGDIYKSLRSAASSFNSHAAQRNIDYRVYIPQTVLWASFDRDKLDKIVYNLLSNAFKFSEDNATISFNLKYDDEDLQIRVSDSGKGIPEDKLPFIFDRFYQADGGSTKENEGSGIGLSLSKDLIELMDGTITVSSELNKGSFFTVHLPIQEIKIRSEKPAEMELQLKKATHIQEPFTFTKTDKRNVPSVLLVEDNSDMRHFIKEQLIKLYRVEEAFNGEEGLQKALVSSPDLIITDLMMPKMDGIELCTKLKTDVHTSHIPVIMLTAKAGIDNKIEGLETGADDYLTKPFDVNELLVRAKNLIRQRQKLRVLFTNKEIQVDPKKITVTSIDEKFLKQLLSLLEVKFSDTDFGVPQMQKELAMSKTQLHRKLKALTNEAPGELLRNFRLKRAAQLLLQKADTVTQIAYQVGFNNLSYFAKCFKEIYGVAPSAYPITGK